MADRREERVSDPIEESPERDGTRRKAQVKMGCLAGYTAPAMLVLLGATKARAGGYGSGYTYTKRRRRRRYY